MRPSESGGASSSAAWRGHRGWPRGTAERSCRSAWGFWSARRYLSLYRPGEAEDVFPYDRPGARWTALRAIRAPLAVMVGGRDEFLDRSPEALIEAFAAQAARAESFTGRIIPGALHGFQGREAAVARAVVDWIRDRHL